MTLTSVSIGLLLCLSSLNVILGTPLFQRNSYALYTEEEDPSIQCPALVDENDKPLSNQISHPQYCDKFVNCWNNTYVIEQCHHGLVFNPNISACDYESNVDCMGKPMSGQSDQMMEMDPLCPQNYGTFPHPQDCTKYVVCSGGNSSIQSCPPNSHYNPYLYICIHGTECAPDTPSTSTSSPSLGSQKSTTEASGNLDGVCPMDPVTDTKHPHPTDCTKYVVCSANPGEKPRVVSCPPNSHYNQAYYVCYPGSECEPGQKSTTEDPENPEKPEEMTDMPTTMIQTSSTSTSTSTTEVPITAAEMSSSTTTTTSTSEEPSMPSEETSSSTTTSPSPGETSPTLGPEEAGSSSTSTEAPPTSSTSSWTDIFKPIIPTWPRILCPIPVGYLPVSGDCSSLVACINGLGNLLRCPYSHHFDPVVGACVRVAEGSACSQGNSNLQNKVVYVIV